MRIILHGFHSHSWCHSISNYYPNTISSSAASDMLKIIYLLHHWGQWRERYEWTFREINDIKKKSPQSAPSNKNHRVFSALLYIKYRVKMHCSGKRRNESIYWATSTWRVFFSFYLFLHAGFISTLKSIYQTFRSGRLAINSLRGGMWKNKTLSKI